MQAITFSDFEMIRIDNNPVPYFSYKTDNVEICLEPCLNGLDVAIYDLNQELLEPKECTNFKKMTETLPEILDKGIEIANRLLQEHYENIHKN